MPTPEVTYQSQKQKIWAAYKELLNQIEEKRQGRMKIEENLQGQQGQPKAKEQAAEQQKPVEEFSVEKIMGGISNLKANVTHSLNNLADKLSEEAEKLERIREAAVNENKNLETIYEIKAGAETLFDILEAQEQRKAEFEERMSETEERLQEEIESKRKKWLMEEEDYTYNLKLKRRKEEAEYEFLRAEKARELGETERNIAEKGSYIKDLESKVAAFPTEKEAAIRDAITKLRERLERENATANKLTTKDVEREREVAALRVANLEQIVSGQNKQIDELERQLAIANQKAQELALKIIEARKEIAHASELRQQIQSDSAKTKNKEVV